jgi:hypothetical protein
MYNLRSVMKGQQAIRELAVPGGNSTFPAS